MQALPAKLIPEPFLARDPDCPVFGLNLTCAWPLPEEAAAPYNRLAAALEKLDPGVYVYPHCQTHITLVTFLNFSRAQRPSLLQLQELRASVEPLIAIVNTNDIPPFRLEFQRPILTAKAAILPILNPTGEIDRLRRQIRESLSARPELQIQSATGSLNIPEIIHSTIMRFKIEPANPLRLMTAFAELAAKVEPFSVTVHEIFLTSETKPYLREGKKLHRFALAG